MKSLLVIGGGITGLSAAWRARALSKTVEITLVEKERRLGGKVLTELRDGFVLEAGADGFLSRKSAGIDFCEELGISGLLREQVRRTSRSFVAQGHKLHPLPEGFSGLVPASLDALQETPLLSEPGRQRAMEEPAIPARHEEEDESVQHFMTRRFGREAFETLIEPLLAGIYAGDAAFLSLKATLPQLRELERRHGSVLAGLQRRPASPARRTPFVTFDRGMAQLVSELSRRLAGGGVRIATGTEAGPISRRRGLWRVERAGGAAIEADAVIVTVPSGQAAALVARLDPRLTETLASIPFASTSVVHLAFRREDIASDLEGYGYVIPRREGSGVLACTWTSSKWHDRAPPGMALLRLYTRSQGSDEELEALTRDELRMTMDITAAPVLMRIFRWPAAMPQYTLDHPRRLDEIEARCARLDGLYLAGASYRGVGIPDCIESGSRAARQVMESAP